MNQPSVLIVEDDDTLLRGLTDNFRKHGYRVTTAQDGPAGLSEALASPPDLILLDIMLPRMNGFNVCSEIRARNIDSTIIMLTAKGQEDDIVRGLELGADDYVTKPFGILELLARAKAFLRRRSEGAVREFEFGDCRLDLESHKLTRGGHIVPLTAKEFGLLQFLLERSGRALTRRDILDAVWGSSVIVSGRSVDRCIATLRSKVEQDPRRPVHIQTIRDIGYRFEMK